MRDSGPGGVANPFTVLHEATEATIIEHYLSSADRRWFCEGVANYLAYRTLETLLGAEAARAYYDVNAEVARYAALRPRVDLERWRVKEDPKSSELPADVNTAFRLVAGPSTGFPDK